MKSESVFQEKLEDNMVQQRPFWDTYNHEVEVEQVNLLAAAFLLRYFWILDIQLQDFGFLDRYSHVLYMSLHLSLLDFVKT